MLRADVEQRRPVAYLDQALPLAFAHRGGAAHQPENSWAAFEHAVSLGYTHLETDTRATQDGILLAFHDRTLDRVTDRQGRIARMPYTEVAGARIGGTEPIPLYRGPDRRLAGREVQRGPEGRAGHPADDGGAAPDRGLGPGVRDLVLGPAAARGPGAAGPAGVHGAVPRRDGGAAADRRPAAGSGNALADKLARTGVHCAQVPLQVATPSFIRRAHEAGLQVHVWTLNRRHEMERALDLGADGIMTDETVLLRELLTERGLWAV